MHQHYELTKYPKLYRKQYWGSFGYEEGKHRDMDKTIFENRDSFVEKYRIKKNIGAYLPKYVNKHTCGTGNSLYDHIEIYETYDNEFIILISPYSVGDESEEKLKKNGWEKIDKMYSLFTKSFIKIVPRKYKRFHK